MNQNLEKLFRVNQPKRRDWSIIGWRASLSLMMISFLLISCATSSNPHQLEIDLSQPAPNDQELVKEGEKTDQNIVIWSLGGNGWAIQLDSRLLIFDYVETLDSDPPPLDLLSLQNGYINPAEIKVNEVLVFVTHAHPDHFDPLIFGWQDQIENISYYFGWQVDDNPAHHYLVGPRAAIESGDLEIYTINSHHADVPEVAFLIKVDELTIYFNGDYMSAYQEDFEYLHSISNRIDVAFVIGWPFPDHQQFQQALMLNDLFHPTYIFASCREGDQKHCQEFSALMMENKVMALIQYSEERGQEFLLSQMVND